jgi:hypothetical protein
MKLVAFGITSKVVVIFENENFFRVGWEVHGGET